MDKKKIILTASQGLFARFGLKKVTTDEIAREANVSKATVYKFFKNKGEIFHEVVKLETEQMLSSITQAIKAETRTERKLKVYLKTKTQKIHNLINFYRVTRETWNEHWPYIEEVRERFMEAEKKLVKQIFVSGNKSGETSIQKTTLHAHIFVISLKSLEYPWALENQNVSLDEIIDLVVDTFLKGASSI